MAAKKSRSASIFNMSFLDVLSCGMGSIILLSLIFSTLVREQRLQKGKRLLVVIEYEHPPRGGDAFWITTPRQELKRFRKVNAKVRVFSVKRAQPGSWKIQASQELSGPYSMLVIYGNWSRAFARLQSSSPGEFNNAGRRPLFVR